MGRKVWLRLHPVEDDSFELDVLEAYEENIGVDHRIHLLDVELANSIIILVIWTFVMEIVMVLWEG